MSEQKTEAPKQEQTKAVAVQNSHLIPRDLLEAKSIAALLANSDAIPKDFIGKPNNVLLAVMHGSELGISPAQAMSSIMVVNGRCSVWGDALFGIVKAHPEYEASRDSYDPAVEGGTATFSIKRKGEEWLTRTFSMEDAQKAGLKGKAGPWQNYPKRMLYMRARAFALRDAFPDKLKGISVAEEMQDVIPGEIVREPAPEQRQADQAAVDAAKAALAPKSEPKQEAAKERIVEAEVVKDEPKQAAPKEEAQKPAAGGSKSPWAKK